VKKRTTVPTTVNPGVNAAEQCPEELAGTVKKLRDSGYQIWIQSCGNGFYSIAYAGGSTPLNVGFTISTRRSEFWGPDR
jgi:hypothetical protein